MVVRRSSGLEGVAELQRNLEALGKNVATKAGNQAVRKGAQHLARHIKSAAPVRNGDSTRSYSTATGSIEVDYGHLKDNIKARKGRSKSRQNVTYIVTTGKAFWGRFLEFGTRKMAARPWFRPAMDEAMDGALAKMVSELRAAIEKGYRGGFNRKR